MENRVKNKLEYLFNCSAKLLYRYISNPSGLEEWFADSVNLSQGKYIFNWEGTSREALQLETRLNSHTRFRWLDDAEDEFFEFRLRMDEGLTGWVARERRLLAISREAYQDPRFKVFSDLPEDAYEAFLSAPVIARDRVVGVINVQHRWPHQHTGSEMEVLTTVGEQVGCLLLLAQMAPAAVETANHVEFVLSSASKS